jgi:hypothetical protein
MKTHVYFAVFDFGDDPHIVTEIIGIEPTGAWAQGDWYESVLPNARRTHSRWFLESGLDHAAAVGPQLDALLAKLEPRKTQIALVQARFPAYIGIAQYFAEVNPGFVLAPETLGRLAKLDLAVDFDQYYFGNE